MNFKCVMAVRAGPPQVLQVQERDLRPPAGNEARIRTLAAAVTRPDISARHGVSLYSDTPLGHKSPFVPGCADIGDVETVGPKVTELAVGQRVGALTIVGGYSESLYWRSDRLIAVPSTLDPAEAVTMTSDYLLAYQVLHRLGQVKAGEKALIVGASGGIGTALLQLGRLAGLTMYALASASKHHLLLKYGATPIDYRSQDFIETSRQAEPAGLDVVLDGMMTLNYIRGGLSLLRRGGRLVSYGEPAGLKELLRILTMLPWVNLLPNGKSFKLYGTSSHFALSRRPFLKDWATLYELLEEGKIEPIIMRRFPILAAEAANRLQGSGQVVGNVVLVAPELL